jgi:hypothetical protein
MNYRIYKLGKGDHFVEVRHVECEDDDQALAAAKRYFNKADLEVWSEGRRVARLRATAHSE